jgi:hypothetical protein
MVLIRLCRQDVVGMLEKSWRRRQSDLHQGGQHPHRRPIRLAAQHGAYGKMAQVADSPKTPAFANRAVSKEDLICITGSFIS